MTTETWEKVHSGELEKIRINDAIDLVFEVKEAYNKACWLKKLEYNNPSRHYDLQNVCEDIRDIAFRCINNMQRHAEGSGKEILDKVFPPEREKRLPAKKSAEIWEQISKEEDYDLLASDEFITISSEGKALIERLIMDRYRYWT